ncbi:MAG: hypothetical protein AVDCRST_MAG40-383, partial [uncultured Gemmatimonadaceae bacterium]
PGADDGGRGDQRIGRGVPGRRPRRGRGRRHRAAHRIAARGARSAPPGAERI